MDSTTISILGCGWLGRPLACSLIRSGISVKGSTTTESKLASLQAEHITPFCFTVEPHWHSGNIQEFWQTETLVLTLPFRRNLEDPFDYKRQMEAVVRCLPGTPVRRVIFTSSTSIYPETVTEADEESPIQPTTPRARALWDVERLLSGHSGFSAVILRLGGLYGPDRPIGKFLAGRKSLSGAAHPVNLIHRDDAVDVMARIIRADVREGTFNVCSDGHPSRLELYTRAAQKIGLPPPEFHLDEKDGGKIVLNAKLKERLHYKFAHPDPLEDV